MPGLASAQERFPPPEGPAATPPGAAVDSPPDGLPPPAGAAGQAPSSGAAPFPPPPFAPAAAVPPVDRAADGTVSVLAPPQAAVQAPATGAPPTPAPPPPSGFGAASGGPAGAAPPGVPAGASAPAAAPAAAASAATRATHPPPAVLAADLLARSLAPPSTPISPADASAPRLLPLLEALERSGDRSRRLWITQAYWKLAAAAARHRFAVEAEERLSLVAPGGNADDLAMLDAAIQGARGRAASATVELVAAQQELSDLVRLPVTEPPPLPADRPLIAAYQTHFETIFAVRPATGRVRAIHRQLPPAHAAILARAEATAAAQERFDVVEPLHAQGKKPINAVLSAHDGLTAQQQAFVEAVAAYNLAIAEYVMAVADLSVPDEPFATMLIGQPIAWRSAPAAAQGAGVVPVSGQASQGQIPQGTVAPGRGPSVPPAAGLSPRLFSSDPGSAPLPARDAPAGLPAATAPAGNLPAAPPPPFPPGG